ncbi:MAG: hypothetical protein JW969_20920 [Spirochaetales bacterium]|nr:hypothetical protein [Spirochaetales bacterium]
MSWVKSLFKFIVKFLIIVLIVVAVISAGLTVYYFVTIQSPLDYLPENFLLYAKIDSLKDVYENVIDLKAAEVVFSSSKDLKSIYKALIEFKSTELSGNFLFRELLNVRTDILIGEDFSPVLVFDPGIKSLVTRLFPIINSMIHIENFDLNILQRGKNTLFDYKIDEDQDLYFAVNNNLIFLSTQSVQLENLFNNYENKTNLSQNTDMAVIKEKVKQGGFIEIYINTDALAKTLADNTPELKPILDDVLFNKLSALSFKISNDSLSLNAYTSISNQVPVLKDFLSYNPPSLQILPHIPETTGLYSAVNFKSFKDLVTVLSYFRKSEVNEILKQIDDGCQMLFHDSFDNLFLSWMGSEAGAFLLTDSPEPVVFLRIKDRYKMDSAMEKLTTSNVLDQESTLILDNVRINKIFFPPFIKLIVDLFVKNLETPYYVISGDYIYFSMSAENLAGLINSDKENRLLIRKELYRKLSQNIPTNGNVVLYYDLSSKTPGFLINNTLITQILKLYERGMLSIYFNESEVKITLKAEGISGKKAQVFPDFPKSLIDGAVSDVYCQTLGSSNAYKLIYINSKDQFIIQDLIEGTYTNANVERNSEICAIINDPFSRKDVVLVYAASGTLYKFDENCKSIDPFPMLTECKGSFRPALIGRELALFSQENKALFFYGLDGKSSKFNYIFSNPLLSAPAYMDNMFAFYPKSFEGKVFLTDTEGRILTGWPKSGGGISFCSPDITRLSRTGQEIVFLTQSGILNVWDHEGNNKGLFPLQLEGVFFENPVFVSSRIITSQDGDVSGKSIAVCNSEGVVWVIDNGGKILKQKTYPEIRGKESRIMAYDFNKDGVEEIFIFGANNLVAGLGSNLELLPGFPLRGSKRPAFADLNYDRKIELITGSYDGNVYAYTIEK